MLKVGQVVLLKQFGKYVRAIVVSIDTDFISLDVNYKKDKGVILKIRKDSKNIIKLDLTSKEKYRCNTEAFAFKNNLA